MRSNEEQSRRGTVLIIARSVLAGYLVCGLLFIVAAIAVANGLISENSMKATTGVTAFLAACVGGGAAAKGNKKNKLITGLLTGCAMFIICAVCQLTVYSTGFPNTWTAVLFGTFISGGITGGILSATMRTRRR